MTFLIHSLNGFRGKSAHFLFLGYAFVWIVIKIEKVLSENKLNIYKKYKESYLSLSLVWNIIAAGFTISVSVTY